MTDDTAPNDMKRRALEALKKKQEAAANNSHGDSKATGNTGSTKGAKQPKARIIRHQGR